MSESNKIPIEIKHLLLTIIDNDGDINDLNKIGYDYLKIKNLIKEEIEAGNATFDNNNLRLTQAGIEYRKKLSKTLNYDKIEEIISPKISGKIDDFDLKQKLFIPSENEIDF